MFWLISVPLILSYVLRPFSSNNEGTAFSSCLFCCVCLFLALLCCTEALLGHFLAMLACLFSLFANSLSPSLSNSRIIKECRDRPKWSFKRRKKRRLNYAHLRRFLWSSPSQAEIHTRTRTRTHTYTRNRPCCCLLAGSFTLENCFKQPQKQSNYSGTLLFLSSPPTATAAAAGHTHMHIHPCSPPTAAAAGHTHMHIHPCYSPPTAATAGHTHMHIHTPMQI